MELPLPLHHRNRNRNPTHVDAALSYAPTVAQPSDPHRSNRRNLQYRQHA